MKKSFLTLMFLVAMTIQAMAQREVVFDFSKNPWNAPTTTKEVADKDANVAKLEDDSKILTTDGVTITQKKKNAKNWNRIVDKKYICYRGNIFTFSVEEGKGNITRIDFYCENPNSDFVEDPYKLSIRTEDTKGHSSWTGNRTEVSFKGEDVSDFKKIVIIVEGGKNEGNGNDDSKPEENLSIFDFSKNTWGVPTTTAEDARDDKKAGKLDDDVKMTTGSVTMTQKKNSDVYWNRIIDNVYMAYKENDFTFTAKEDKVITRIEFVNKPYFCDITYKGKKVECDNEDDTPYIWTGKEKSVTFNATLTSKFKAIKVTLENNVADEIEAINAINQKANNRIYNIQGQYVGTRSELSTLPKGIYIINGKKIVR